MDHLRLKRHKICALKKVIIPFPSWRFWRIRPEEITNKILKRHREAEI